MGSEPRHGSLERAHFVKSPEELAREKVRAEKTVSNLTQKAQLHGDVLAGLQREIAAARASGVPAARLPVVHGQMSPQDAQQAMRQINLAMGRPPDFSPGQQQKSVAVAAPPAPPKAQVAPPAAPAFNGGLNSQPSSLAPSSPKTISAPLPRSPLDSLTDSMATSGQIAQGQKVKRTSGGLAVQTPSESGPRDALFQPSAEQALIAHFGDAWVKADPAARTAMLQTLPKPAVSRGTVIDPGATAPNARGESTVQTPRGTEIAGDPMKDVSKTWLPKGDPLIGGADRGVVIDPKYRTPGASAIGTGTGGNWPGFAPQPDVKPAVPSPISPASPTIAMGGTPPVQPTNPSPMASVSPASRAVPGQKMPGTMQNPAPPSLFQMTTPPNAQTDQNRRRREEDQSQQEYVGFGGWNGQF